MKQKNIPWSYFLVLILFEISLQSCAVLEAFESSKIKRYKSVEIKTLKDKDPIDIDIFSSKVTEKKEDKYNVWTLTDDGQAEFFKVLNNRFKKDKDFISHVEKQYKKPKSSPIKTDYTTKNLKLIFSISKERRYQNLKTENKNGEIGYSLADRIEHIKTMITLPDKSPIKFTKWNKFETEYGKIDIGDVSFNRSLSFTGSIGKSNTAEENRVFSENAVDYSNTTGTSLSPSLQANVANAYTEAQKIRYRYLALNGTMTEKSINFEEEGIREIDLTGNVVIDVAFTFKAIRKNVSHFSNLYTETAALNPLNKVKLSIISVKLPDIVYEPTSITGNLQCDYVYRHVKNEKGKKTFYEWDDEVIYYKGTITKKDIELFTTTDYLPPMTQIVHNIFYPKKSMPKGSIVTEKKGGRFIQRTLNQQENVDLFERKFLKLRRKDNPTEEFDLLFNDFSAAQNFWNYLIEVSTSLLKQISELKKVATPDKKVQAQLAALKAQYKKDVEFSKYSLYHHDKSVTLEYINTNYKKLDINLAW